MFVTHVHNTCYSGGLKGPLQVAKGHQPSAGARKMGAKRPEFLVN